MSSVLPNTNSEDSMGTAVARSVTAVRRLVGGLTLIDLVFLCGALYYAYLFCDDLAPYWFHPHWSTDDALQQTFPFHEVFHPGIFTGDIIYEAMKGYLAPLHYWMSWIITWAAGDPIMMNHWMMLIQILLTVGFLFAAVKHAAGFAPACFSAAWILHTRHVMQRITAGLPRGWAAPILAALIYFMLKKNHWGVLATLFLGCLLHPPATLLGAIAYGMYLTWGVLRSATRPECLKPFIILVLLSPIFLITTYYVVKRPDSMGQMVSYEQAAKMPEFQASEPKGRFPFVPLVPAMEEIESFGFHAFTFRLYNPGKFLRANMQWVVVSALGLICLIGYFRKRRAVADELWAYLLATFIVYFASREFAFKLYVPNRHLQFPMAIWFAAVFPIAIWKVFSLDPARDTKTEHSRFTKDLRKSWLAAVVLVLFGVFIYSGSGNGLQGTANFNYAFDKKGGIWRWMRANTPERALIAGYPTFIDAVQLFGMRRGYATTETAHPFYPGYYAEINRRLIISLKAHYAKNLQELLALLEPEGIDYFVFDRSKFYPEELAKAEYFPPLNEMVHQLTSRPPDQYAYQQLPKTIDVARAPYMPFRDSQSAVVDLKALKVFLEKNPS